MSSILGLQRLLLFIKELYEVVKFLFLVCFIRCHSFNGTIYLKVLREDIKFFDLQMLFYFKSDLIIIMLFTESKTSSHLICSFVFAVKSCC